MYEYKAIVKSAYDGDTVTLDIDLGCWVWLHNEKCRLHGIDTPELRGSEEEKARGRAARDWVRSKILDQEVMIRTYRDKTGKYGRLLVDILFTDPDDGKTKNLGTELVELGHAVYRRY